MVTTNIKGMSQFDWSPYGLLPKAVEMNVIDGFFVPHEWGVRPPATWPGGRGLVSILTPRGRHLIARGSWRNYGYPSCVAFTEALREARVMCKTPAGAVCLGPSRFVPGARIICCAQGLIAGKTMEFIAGTPGDLALMEDFFNAHFPGASVESRVAGWPGQIQATDSFKLQGMVKGFLALDSRRRTQSLLLLLAGLISVAGTILAACGLLWTWLAVFSLVGYAGVASLSMARAEVGTEGAEIE